VLNVGVQVNYFRAIVDQDLRSIRIGSVAPTSWGPTFTQGAAGAGSVSRTLTTYEKRSPSYTALL